MSASGLAPPELRQLPTVQLLLPPEGVRTAPSAGSNPNILQMFSLKGVFVAVSENLAWECAQVWLHLLQEPKNEPRTVPPDWHRLPSLELSLTSGD